jgi:hypothetical protein
VRSKGIASKKEREKEKERERGLGKGRNEGGQRELSEKAPREGGDCGEERA